MAGSRCVPSTLYVIASMIETVFRHQLIGVHSGSFVVVLWLFVEQGPQSPLAKFLFGTHKCLVAYVIYIKF
jgi:hypothetical protein